MKYEHTFVVYFFVINKISKPNIPNYEKNIFIVNFYFEYLIFF